MLFWNRTKRTALLVGAVALAILIGTGAVMAAQSHVGPFSSRSSAPANAKSSAHDGEVDPTETEQPNQGEDQELTGIIQSIDTTGQTFVLAPDDGSAAVTIAFDANTDIEHEDGDNGSNPLTVGAHVTVEVVTRTDGSLYAKEIQLVQDGDGSGDGSGGSDNGGSGGSGGGGSDGGGSGH